MPKLEGGLLPSEEAMWSFQRKVSGDLRLSPERAKEAEDRRFAKVSKDLSLVFKTMEEDLPSLTKEQVPTIVEYLKPTTEGGLGGDEYLKMAPGIAILGFEVARSGFGWVQPNSGDKKLDREIEAESEKRYEAAHNVLDQLLKKMYPEGLLEREALLGALEGPSNQDNSPAFGEVKSRLVALIEDGLIKFGDLNEKFTKSTGENELLKYQAEIDSLISFIGDTLGGLAEEIEEWNEGKKSYNRVDILTLTAALSEAEKMRKEIIKFKYPSLGGRNRMLDFSPSALKKIESVERRARQK